MVFLLSDPLLLDTFVVSVKTLERVDVEESGILDCVNSALLSIQKSTPFVSSIRCTGKK